jgi:hypothetical protein
VTRYHEVFQQFEEVDCEAPLADTLEPRETDRVSYMPFCTVDVSALNGGTSGDTTLTPDAGESP